MLPRVSVCCVYDVCVCVCVSSLTFAGGGLSCACYLTLRTVSGNKWYGAFLCCLEERRTTKNGGYVCGLGRYAKS